MKVLVKCYTYNHERFIEQALQGFVMQKTDFPFLVLVIDDCSTDGNVEIIRKYEEKYPEIIKGIYLTENHYSKGKSTTVYTEPYEKEAEYIALCEGDDFWTDPLKLQKQHDQLEAHPECTICFGRVRKIKADGSRMMSTVPKFFRFRSSEVKLEDLMRIKFGKGHSTFQTSSFFFRSSMARKKEELKSTLLCNLPYGDLGVMLTCLIHGNGRMVQDEMSCYRVLSGGYMSHARSNPEFGISELNRMLRSMQDFREYFGDRFDREISRQEQRCKRKIDKILVSSRRKNNER